MATVLLSLCNLKRNGARFPLIVANLGRRRFGLVDCAGWIAPHETGVTGLLVTDRAIYACTQGGEGGRVVVLDRSLRQIGVVEDPRFRDLHSIRRIGDRICVVSTGNASLLAFGEDDPTVHELWAHEQADGRLHINDVGIHDGRLFVLSHVHPGWSGEGRSGALWYVDTGEVIIDGLKHPHSIVEAGGVLHCLSSATGELVSRDWASGTVGRRRYGGYLRGLAVTESGFAIGQSSVRFYSRKRGPSVNPIDLDAVIGDPRFMSFLAEAGERKVGRRHNLTHLGLEIYDVVTADVDFNAVVAKASPQLRAQALYQRIAELEMLLDEQDAGEAGEGADDPVGEDGLDDDDADDEVEAGGG